MGGFLQDGKSKCSGSAFNGVCSAEDGIELLGVWRFWHQIQQMLLHIRQQFVGFIKECLVKIANIHAHAITSDWLVAMLERQPKERPQAVLNRPVTHSDFRRFHAGWPAPPAGSALKD